LRMLLALDRNNFVTPKQQFDKMLFTGPWGPFYVPSAVLA
jgi:hypothetical protein